MRIIATIIVWVAFIGSMAFYMKQRDVAGYASDDIIQFKKATRVYALELTPSFVPESDPFALNLDNQNTTSPLIVKLGDREIFRISAPPDTVEYYRIEPLTHLHFGKNEIFVEASPPAGDYFTSNALRIRLMENGHPLAEKTIWSPPGAKISGTFQFNLKENGPEPLREEHDEH